MTKHVSFSTVSVRIYDITIGDSPSVTTGVPLSLDWAFIEEESRSLEDHETSRMGNRRQCFLLTADQRRYKLTECFGIDINKIDRFGYQRRAIRQRSVKNSNFSGNRPSSSNVVVFVPNKKSRRKLECPVKRNAIRNVESL